MLAETDCNGECWEKQIVNKISLTSFFLSSPQDSHWSSNEQLMRQRWEQSKLKRRMMKEGRGGGEDPYTYQDVGSSSICYVVGVSWMVPKERSECCGCIMLMLQLITCSNRFSCTWWSRPFSCQSVGPSVGCAAVEAAVPPPVMYKDQWRVRLLAAM